MLHKQGICLAEVKSRSSNTSGTLWRLDRYVACPWKAIPSLHLTCFASFGDTPCGSLMISLCRNCSIISTLQLSRASIYSHLTKAHKSLRSCLFQFNSGERSSPIDTHFHLGLSFRLEMCLKTSPLSAFKINLQ